MLKWWLVASMTGLVMLATVAALRPVLADREIAALLTSPVPGDAERQFLAVVVAQPEDCDGNLGFFAVLERPSLAPHIRAHSVLIQGMASDTLTVRARLPRALQQARISLLTSAHRRLLHTLGHRATPLLLLYDPEQRLRYAGVVPMTPTERAIQLAAITPLVTDTPRSHR